MNPTPNPQYQAYPDKYWDVVLAAIGWHKYNAHGSGALVVQDAGRREESAIYVPIAMLVNPHTVP